MTPDSCDMLRNSADYGPAYIEFNAPGSTFTASFGGDFPNIDAVNARCGDGLTFRSTTGTDPVATDNEDGTFTVTIEGPESSTLLLVR